MHFAHPQTSGQPICDRCTSNVNSRLVVSRSAWRSRTMRFMAPRTAPDPVESVHHVVNSGVTKVGFALHRDFPDAVRVSGQERL